MGPLLRNIDAPEPRGGKIALRFKSNALKEHFMEEMSNQRSRDALKAAITETYGSELELQIISPHESDTSESDTGNLKDQEKVGVQQITESHESAMVRAAMAMGATVASQEATDGLQEDDSEK